MECQNNSEQCVINCANRMEIGSVDEQKEILLQALALGKPITLNGADLTYVDTAGLQLLLAFTQAATAAGIDWEWESPSSVLITRASLLGIQELLQLPKQ